jgi:cupin fold WbuC family metalloprotein
MKTHVDLVRKVEGVYICESDLVNIDNSHISFLKEAALQSEKKRARICAHHPDDQVHEMIIVLHQSTAVAVHRHLNKSESFHVVEGEAEVILYTDDGELDQRFLLSKDNHFYCRINSATYHTVIPLSEFFVFHETTKGPFLDTETEFLHSLNSSR